MTFSTFWSYRRLFVLIMIFGMLSSCTTFKRHDPSPVGTFYPYQPIQGVYLTKDDFWKSKNIISFSEPAKIRAVGKMTWNSLIGDYFEVALISPKLDHRSGDYWISTDGDYYATISWLQANGRIEYTGSKTSGDYFWGKGGLGYWLKILLALLFALYLFSGFKKIPTGHKGITLWFGARSENVYGEGLAWHLPLFSTIEVVDCKVRFIDERNMTVALAYFINVNLKTSVSYKISNPHNYLNNYSISDLDGKVKTYVTDSLRQYLTKSEVTEKEILAMDANGYKQQQIKIINDGYLKNLGIEITDIIIVIIEITDEMRSFFEVLRQADILHDKLPYKEALEKALLINGKIGQTNFNLAIKGLPQLKRLTALS